MSANRSDRAQPPAETPSEPQPMSRAERRAAAKGRAVREHDLPHGVGKVAGVRAATPGRRQYSNRRSGG